MPELLPFEIEEFEQYKNEWVMLWRGLGRIYQNGVWIPPISYYEAQFIPTRKLHVFMSLDSMIYKLAKQKGNKK